MPGCLFIRSPQLSGSRACPLRRRAAARRHTMRARLRSRRWTVVPRLPALALQRAVRHRCLGPRAKYPQRPGWVVARLRSRDLELFRLGGPPGPLLLRHDRRERRLRSCDMECLSARPRVRPCARRAGDRRSFPHPLRKRGDDGRPLRRRVSPLAPPTAAFATHPGRGGREWPPGAAVGRLVGMVQPDRLDSSRPSLPGCAHVALVAVRLQSHGVHYRRLGPRLARSSPVSWATVSATDGLARLWIKLLPSASRPSGSPRIPRLCHAHTGGKLLRKSSETRGGGTGLARDRPRHHLDEPRPATVVEAPARHCDDPHARSAGQIPPRLMFDDQTRLSRRLRRSGGSRSILDARGRRAHLREPQRSPRPDLLFWAVRSEHCPGPQGMAGPLRQRLDRHRSAWVHDAESFRGSGHGAGPRV